MAYTTTDRTLRFHFPCSLKRESVRCQEIVNSKWEHTLAMLKKFANRYKKNGKF